MTPTRCEIVFVSCRGSERYGGAVTSIECCDGLQEGFKNPVLPLLLNVAADVVVMLGCFTGSCKCGSNDQVVTGSFVAKSRDIADAAPAWM
jgi:hypothetical protein